MIKITGKNPIEFYNQNRSNLLQKIWKE